MKTPTFLDIEIEIVRIQIDTKPKPLFIGAFYGAQENKTKEELDRQFSILKTHILLIKQRGSFVLTGDFNANLKIDITTEVQALSKNGRRLKDLTESTDSTHISLKSKTGIWTRVNRANPKRNLL